MTLALQVINYYAEPQRKIKKRARDGHDEPQARSKRRRKQSLDALPAMPLDVLHEVFLSMTLLAYLSLTVFEDIQPFTANRSCLANSSCKGLPLNPPHSGSATPLAGIL